MAMSDNVAAHRYVIKYRVEREMTPKQTMKEMSLTQQFSSVNKQLVHTCKWHRRFQWDGKRLALKRTTDVAE